MRVRTATAVVDMVAPGEAVLDKYLVDRVIGAGGMATVVAATHLQLNEQVAIKLMHPELAEKPTIVERFMREARAAARLKGEHVARVHDVGVTQVGLPYIVMELLVGSDLSEVLKTRRALSSTEAIDFLLQVCEALAEAHQCGIVHRDIKPSNLFITRRPDGSALVKVLDFGISKILFDNKVSDLTHNEILGTPSYMSPEQMRGLPTVDARADIWSLGIVLYRLLSGHCPFTADSTSALAIQCATDPTPSLTVPVPPGLDAIIYRCLQKDPARRWQSVAELAFALAPYAGDQRAAQIIIERTQSILQWTPPPREPSPPQVPPAEHTTLGSSVGAIEAKPPAPARRSAYVIGAVAAGVVSCVLAAISLVGGRDDATSSAAQPSPATSAQPTPATAAEPAPEPRSVEPVAPIVEPSAEQAPAPVAEPVAEKAAPARKIKKKNLEKAEPLKPLPPNIVPRKNPLDTRL